MQKCLTKTIEKVDRRLPSSSETDTEALANIVAKQQQ